MKIRRIALLLTLALFFVPQFKAQDIFAGFISAKQIEGFEYEITMTTWTNDWHNPNFKRCSADFVVFHNGAASNFLEVPRVNGGPQQYNQYCPIISRANAGEKIKDKVRKNVYVGRYTFPGPGTAKVNFQTKGREINISNIAFPFATNFSVETEFEVFATGTQNSTPELVKDLLVPATAGTNFSFANYVIEPDNGDGMNFTERVPSSVNPSNHTAISSFGGAYAINNASGDVTWASPSSPSFLLGSIKIDHSRSGNGIGYSYLDYIIEMDRSASLPEVLASDVKIGPQPAVETLFLEFTLKHADKLSGHLLDLTGRQVQEFKSQPLGAGRQQISLDLESDLSNGLYILEMQLGGESLSRKVMVRR